jgi:YbgC/YbaW family acyl-CoA thioester hydrolase
MKTPESIHSIRFQDCDPFNHLNNSKYIDYFINAREDHLSTFHGFETYAYARKTGKSWVVSQNQIAYFSPAVLMEKVVIQSTILEWNTSDILVEMRMWDSRKTRLKSLLWMRLVHYDLKRLERIEHDDQLTGSFTQLVNSLNEKQSFDERLSAVKGKAFGTF